MHADPGRQGLRRRPLGGRDPRVPRHAHRAGRGTARGATARSRRTSTSSRACARASSRTARACCGRRSTWPRATSTCATRCCTGSCTPSHPRTGDAVVHLPDLRLRARPVGRDRGHHALDLHARVRGPPAALRLVPREPAGAVAAAPDRVRAPQPDLHGALEALPAASSSRTAACAAGTTRACPRSRASAGAAFPPEGLRDFAALIGVGKRDGVVDYAMLEHCVRDVLNRQALRRFAVLRPLKLTIENYPEGQVEELDAVNNPEDAERRNAQGPVLARAPDRARGLHGGPAEEVLPARARARGAPALRLLRHLPRGGEGRRGRDRRAALQLRPGDARRRRARRAASEGDAALALGRARRCPPRCGSTSTLRAGRSGRRRRSARRPEPGVRGGAHGRRRRAGRGVASPSARRCSSSGSATSAPTRTRSPGVPSSIARSRSRTPGSRSRPRASRTNRQGGCCAAHGSEALSSGATPTPRE